MFQRRIDYGVMTSCLVKPALYIVQKTGPRLRLAEPSLAETESEQEEDTGNLSLSVISDHLRSSQIISGIICYFSLPSY